MSKRIITLLLSCAFALSLYAQDSKKLPNIVIYLMDDMGYGCINANGAPKEILKTPNIDSLAKSGMSFTNAQTPSSVCSPTRYALLTGSYPWRRSDMKFGVWGYEPNSISTETLTIQKMLQQKGYQTACIGKWHLGYGTQNRPFNKMDFRDDFSANGVNSTGFNYSFTLPSNHGDTSGIWVENDKIWNLKSNELKDCGNTYYGPKFQGYDASQRVDEEAVQMCTTKAISWLKTLPKDEPFFLYFSNPAIHEPITPSKKNKGKSGCGIFGDFIMDADDSVGELVSYLKSRGDFDNTIFIFTSDNGTNAVAQDYDRTKRKDGGHPLLNAIQDAELAGLKPNGELREGKCLIFDGGTRVPFIVVWGDKIPKGEKNSQAFSLIDIFATIAKATGVDLKGSKPDSFDVMPIWLNKKFTRPNIVTYSLSGVKSIRNGDFKYINGKPESGKNLQSKPENFEQLYDLNKDLNEKNNIIESEKQRAQELKNKLSEMENK